MKKLLLLAGLYLCQQNGAAAQGMRNVDIQPRVVSPTASTNFTTGAPFQFVTEYHNLGSDTLKATDTIRVALIMDGFFTFNGSVGGAPDSFIYRETGHLLYPGQYFTVSYTPFNLSNTVGNGSHYWCLRTYTYGPDLRDTNTANNSSCIPFTFRALGVDNINPAAVSFYPQPAGNSLSWKLPVGHQVQEIALYDMPGRQVLEVKNNLSDNTISVSHLPDGMYNIRLLLEGGEMLRQQVQMQH